MLILSGFSVKRASKVNKMSKKEAKIFDPKDRKILYSFWESLPKLKFVKDAEKVYYAHNARILILKTLGEGIKEKNEKTGAVDIIRRALNIQEIYQRIQVYNEEKRQIEGIEWKDFDISLHNLYFHIQKLEEAGLIQTITILREGKHNVSYYGRKAQIMIFRLDYEEYEKIQNAFQAMAKLAPFVDAKFDSEDVNEFYNRYVSIGKDQVKKLFEQLASFQTALDKTDVDPVDILNFLELLSTVNSEFIALLNEMADYFNLEID